MLKVWVMFIDAERLTALLETARKVAGRPDQTRGQHQHCVAGIFRGRATYPSPVLDRFAIGMPGLSAGQ